MTNKELNSLLDELIASLNSQNELINSIKISKFIIQNNPDNTIIKLVTRSKEYQFYSHISPQEIKEKFTQLQIVESEISKNIKNILDILVNLKNYSELEMDKYKKGIMGYKNELIKTIGDYSKLKNQEEKIFYSSTVTWPFQGRGFSQYNDDTYYFYDYMEKVISKLNIFIKNIPLFINYKYKLQYKLFPFRKTQSFNLNKVNKSLFGNITINVNLDLFEKSSISDSIPIINNWRTAKKEEAFLNNLKSFNMDYDEYCSKIFPLTTRAILNLFINYPNFFINIYGNNININFIIKYVFQSPYPGFVNLGSTDPMQKVVIIKLNLSSINRILLNSGSVGAYQDLDKTLIHELSHLYDLKSLKEADTIKFKNYIFLRMKGEGIAMFSEKMNFKELKFSRKDLEKNLNFKPLRELFLLFIERKKQKTHDSGLYICEVIFAGYIYRRDKINLFNIEKVDEKYHSEATLFTRVLSQMNLKQFYKRYLQDSELLGLKLIIDKEKLEKIINQA